MRPQDEPPAKSDHALAEGKDNDGQQKNRHVEAFEGNGKLGKIEVFEDNP